MQQMKTHKSLRQRDTHKSLNKSFEILMTFTPHNQPMSITELNEKLGIHKSTLSRILTVMKQYGLVHQDEESKRYNLGPMSLALGRAVVKSLSNNLVYIAKPYVDRLRDKILETVTLEIVSGNGTTIAYMAEGSHRVQIIPKLGERMPSNAAAGAKAIMAFSQPKVVEKFLKNGLPRLTPNTITDVNIFEKKLEEYKQQGFSVDAEELSVGGFAFGVPIFNFNKIPEAAIVVVAPSSRAKNTFINKNISLLKATAAEISSRLYFVEEE
jgi:IclR family transcriptional regulator, KDG regulon repressor